MIIVQRPLADKLVEGLNSSVAQVGLYAGNTEISGNGYSRITTNPNFSYIQEDATAFVYGNSNILIFPQATGNWANIDRLALFDSSGALLCFLVLPYIVTVTAGNQLIFFQNSVRLKVFKQMS